MFGIQFGFASPCEACSKAAFLQTANSAKVKEAIKKAGMIITEEKADKDWRAFKCERISDR